MEGGAGKRGERRNQPYELTGFAGCVMLKLLGGGGGVVEGERVIGLANTKAI
jgi:hypothetical protein